jgi:hypothetical protein
MIFLKYIICFKNKNVAISVAIFVLIFMVYQINEASRVLKTDSLVDQFYIQKNSIKYNYLQKYPDFLKCRKEALNKWQPDSRSMFTNLNRDYMVFDNSSTRLYGQEYTRAVVLYLPHEMAKKFTPEFKWLFRTWIEIHSTEPKKWRTDLVVFIENNKTFFESKESMFLEELNCKYSNRRVSKSDKPMCTLIDYRALANRKFPHLKNKIFSKNGMKANKV